MARKQDDVTILLRMTKAERERINRALGRGNVNAAAVKLLLEHVEGVERSQPQLDSEVSAA